MDAEDIKALNRARVTAGWSYLGAVVPLVGWILGIISLSNLGSIEASDNTRAKKRLQSVKKLAIGGLILSTIVALVYGGGTYWNIQNTRKEQKLAAQAKLDADEKDCEQQIIAINNKIFTLNGQYTSLQKSPIAFYSTTDLDKCKNGTASALSDANTNYQNAVSAARTRCLAVADQTYNDNLRINAVSSYKDANGQTVYSLTQANSERITQSYQNDKNACNTQFPAL